MQKPIVTFAGWGNYNIAFKTLLEQVGLEVIPPSRTNSKTISEGARISPEMFCFPIKATIGNYLPALRKGANTIFMAQNVGGSCRQRYYGAIQSKILKENGWEVNFIDLKISIKNIYSKVKELSGASFWQIFRATRFFFKKLMMIEKVEKLAQYYRPREIDKGSIERLLYSFFSKLDKLDKEKYFPNLKREVLKDFSNIKIDKQKQCPRVALVGEIYTVSDSDINFEVEKKLGKEGIEVHREMELTYHLKKIVFPWKDWIIQRKINPYLRSTVGGHGRDAIYEMLHYAQNGFDGVVHILPFGCMPEVSVRPILEKIHKKSKIPFLSLSIDEQVAEAGLNTRIEAFVDVIKNYHKSKNL
jgi:predicted nucleotide-binding protein (sugar kinase/HSP70/actin superfamily)